MKRLTWFIAASLSMMAALEASARNLEFSSASTDDRSIIISVHPYTTRKDRREFHLKGQMRKLFPVGVLIQNNGGGKIGIQELDVMAARGRDIYVRNLTPYIERPFGVIAGMRIVDDGEGVNARTSEKYAIRKSPMVGINEIFYAPRLAPGEAHYGIVYLDERNSTTHPRKIRKIAGIRLVVDIQGESPAVVYRATVPLDGEGVAQIVPVPLESLAVENQQSQAFYIGPPENKPGSRALYEASKALSDCFCRSLGKIKIRNEAGFTRYAAARISFSKHGDRLSHEFYHPSGYSMIDDYARKTIKNMQKCDLSHKAGVDKVDGEEPYYTFTFATGDTAVKKEEERARSGNDQ